MRNPGFLTFIKTRYGPIAFIAIICAILVTFVLLATPKRPALPNIIPIPITSGKALKKKQTQITNAQESPIADRVGPSNPHAVVRTLQRTIASTFARRYNHFHSLIQGVRNGNLWKAFRGLVEDQELKALANTLASQADDKVLQQLVASYQEGRSELKHFTLLILALSGKPELCGFLKEEFRAQVSGDNIAASFAAWGLSRLGTSDALEPLILHVTSQYSASEAPDQILQYAIGMGGEVGMNALVSLTDRLLTEGKLGVASIGNSVIPISFCMDVQLCDGLRNIVSMHANPILRAMALQPLLSIGTADNVNFVVDRFALETDPLIRAELGKSLWKNAITGALTGLSNEARLYISDYVKTECGLNPALEMRVLVAMDPHHFLPQVEDLLLGIEGQTSVDPTTRYALMLQLAATPQPEVIALLQRYALTVDLTDPSGPLLTLAAMPQLDDPTLVNRLFNILQNTGDFVRYDSAKYAVMALSKYSVTNTDALTNTLTTIYDSSSSPKMRLAILDGMASFGPNGIQLLEREARTSNDPIITFAAWEALARIQEFESRADLIVTAKTFIREKNLKGYGNSYSPATSQLVHQYVHIFTRVYTTSPTQDDIPFLEQMAAQPSIPIYLDGGQLPSASFLESIRNGALAALELLKMRSDD